MQSVDITFSDRLEPRWNMFKKVPGTMTYENPKNRDEPTRVGTILNSGLTSAPK